MAEAKPTSDRPDALIAGKGAMSEDAARVAIPFNLGSSEAQVVLERSAIYPLSFFIFDEACPNPSSGE